jgi:pSer/pThr/pTyr-binding forkhead associated (FHA) protein
MFRSDGDRRSFSLTRDITVIGRREDCDLRIPLGEVSRKHCRLVRDGDSLRLEDLGSSNGTYHNGQRVQEAILSPGDSVQVGPLVFVLQVDGIPPEDELAPVTVGTEESHEEQFLADEGPLQPTAQSEFGGSGLPTLGDDLEGLESTESAAGLGEVKPPAEAEPATGSLHEDEQALDGLESPTSEDIAFEDLMDSELSGGQGGEHAGEPAAPGKEGQEAHAGHDDALGLDELDIEQAPLDLDEDEDHHDPLKIEGEHESSPHPH